MKLTLDTSVLNSKILKPLSRVVDDCILTIANDKIESVATVASGGIIVYIKYNVDTDIKDPTDLNIKDISKLTSVLNCIKGQTIDMTIEGGAHIKYKSDEFKFKFGLTEDGVIPKPKLKKEKLENIHFNTSTPLNVKIFYDILKASSFIKSDDVKLYFYTKDDEDGKGLYCDITNKVIMNSDSITIKLSDSYDGEDVHKELICDIEHIRKMNIQKDSDIYLYFNSERGFTIFDLIDDAGRVRYILPTLSK
jgi:hypothetical protein